MCYTLFKSARGRIFLTHTVYVHPALAQLQRTRGLDVVNGLRESARYRLVEERQEAS
jgi:hypothetical protein